VLFRSSDSLTKLSQGLYISSDIQAVEFIPNTSGATIKVQLKTEMKTLKI
jgi:hypothetical protein